MNHDFISSLKSLIPPFHIYLRLILCTHIYDVLPHLLMDILQMFNKLLFFSTTYLSFIQLSQFRCISGTIPIYNLEWQFTCTPIERLVIYQKFAYNNSINKSIGNSKFLIVYGNSPKNASELR